jgi:cyclophilin family peptidyl-prolyl cis-trans isomerase/protein-disulfide isomerase
MKKFLILVISCGFLYSCNSTPKPTSPLSTIPSITTPLATSMVKTAVTMEGSIQGFDVPSGCTVISPKPTPGPTLASIFPPITSKDWVRGSLDAPITILEYGDFQCPYCARLAPVLAQVLGDYSNQVRMVYRHFPLISIHDKAALSVQASEAAGRQGKFWEMHDMLFNKQSEWTQLSLDDYLSWLLVSATELGLEVDKFKQNMESQDIVQLAQQAWENNKALGIPYTPFVLVNDQIWPDRLPLDDINLRSVIDLDILEKRQYTTCPPLSIDTNRTYTATINTEKGDIHLNLFSIQAPLAVNNFIFLSKNGWYDGVTFHRVIPGYIAQAGDPSGTGYGTPGYAFINEIAPGLRFDKAGILAMANVGADTNGSQFFITMEPAPQLDGKYTIFGQVTSGMEVVNNLTARDPAQSPNLPPGDKILTIEIGAQ